ncbi:MAG: aminotransferase class I/II-fold pyridoxal phosphate-dependent enzyme [Pirellulaceae bacterium]|nr:aminotransferase class I/II-fold pyridoxal phosphate-dependent enzyme [Pirellulaceae bacterium]
MRQQSPCVAATIRQRYTARSASSASEGRQLCRRTTAAGDAATESSQLLASALGCSPRNWRGVKTARSLACELVYVGIERDQDYTGLNRHPDVIKAVQDAVAKYETGSGTSAMSGGMCELHKRAEKMIAKLLGKEAVMLFPTGYSTNLGVISALAGTGDLIVFDRESHASIIDGIKLSGAKYVSFRHNAVEDLVKKLNRAIGKYDNIFVVVESAYSMSGDLAPLNDIANLKEKFPFFLYVDEAHSFSFYGQHGAGYCQECGVIERVDFLMSTLSKATAAVGGFVACDRRYLALLKWSANAYIFQACFPPADAAAVISSLNILQNDPSIASKLHELNRYMRDKLEEFGFDLRQSQSPVVPVYFTDDEELGRINVKLYSRHIFTVSVLYPAVKRGEGRLRFIVTCNHTIDQINYTVRVLSDLVKKSREKS